MQQFFTAHADRLTIEQLPAYSPDFNPIEHLWKKVKKEVTHLKHFRDCSKDTGFIQPVHDGVRREFVDGLRLELHATYPAQDAP